MAENSKGETKWVAILGVLGTLLGALVGGLVTAHVSSQSIEAQRQLEEQQYQRQQKEQLREKREPYYLAYEDSVQKYVTVVDTRNKCLEAKAAACRYSTEDHQTARYELQQAINDIWTFGSSEIRITVGLLAKTMPETDVGFSGQPELGPIDTGTYDLLMASLTKTICRDISPDPDGCPKS